MVFASVVCGVLMRIQSCLHAVFAIVLAFGPCFRFVIRHDIIEFFCRFLGAVSRARSKQAMQLAERSSRVH